MRAARALALLLVLSSCAGALREGVFTKDQVRYRLTEPDSARWRRFELSGNDLAWVAPGTGQLLAVNATCRDHEDPPLEVLTNHLLLGFTERERVTQRVRSVDGREALHSTWRANLDGVPVDLELLVLKNGCVHDFSAVAPRGQGASLSSVFAALVDGFSQESRR